MGIRLPNMFSNMSVLTDSSSRSNISPIRPEIDIFREGEIGFGANKFLVAQHHGVFFGFFFGGEPLILGRVFFYFME